MHDEHRTDITKQKSNSISESAFSSDVPFSLDLGLSTVQGILSLYENFIRIEWRNYDLFDSPKGAMQSLDIDLVNIGAVVFKKKLIGSNICLVCKKASDLQEIPLPAGVINELKCSVKSKHRSNAELWTAELLMRLAECS